MAIHNVIVAGVGGQGSIMASHIIAQAAIRAGFNDVRVGETYGAAMRGGSVVSHVRIGGAYAPLIEEDEAELIVALEPLEGLRNAVKYLSPKGIVIMNNAPSFPVDTNMGYAKYPDLERIVKSIENLGEKVIMIPAHSMAIELGEIKVVSAIMIGAVAGSGLLNIGADMIRNTLIDRVPSKMLDVNLKAFNQGYEFINKSKIS